MVDYLSDAHFVQVVLDAELGDQTRLTPLPRRHWHRIAPQPSLRCPRILLQVPRRRLRARVLLLAARQQEANDIQVQVSALRQGESPKPRLGIATYLRRHFRLRRKSDINRAGRTGVGESYRLRSGDH